jgi:DHA2 family multidrug resistance protein
MFAIWSVRRLRVASDLEENPPIDVVGFALLMVAVGSLQLCLERGVGRSWRESPELVVEMVVTVLAFGAMTLRARYSTFTVFRLAVFKDVNFALAAFYNFMTSGLLFVTVIFLPALAEGPLGFPATLAGFSIVPRAVLMTVVMLLVGRLIGKIDYRILLGSGWMLMAAGLAILSRIDPGLALPWIVVGSAIQAAGAGLLFTPHSTLAYSTLRSSLRTDASGVYSLLRQLGFASGVALMTAVLRAKIGAHLDDPAAASTATWLAYRDCFQLMAIVSLIVAPGVFVFRVPALARS